MRSLWKIVPLMLGLLVGGCGKVKEEPPSKLHHVLGALQIRDPKQRDAALAEACREVADQGESTAVTLGLPKI